MRAALWLAVKLELDEDEEAMETLDFFDSFARKFEEDEAGLDTAAPGCGCWGNNGWLWAGTNGCADT